MRAPTVLTRSTLARIMLAAAMVLATRWLGWPAPAVVGAAAAACVAAFERTPPERARRTTPARESALAALIGWGALLAWSMLGGRAPGVVRMLGGLVGVRGPTAVAVAALLLLLTLALGAALAWAGATLVTGLLGTVTASAPGRVTLSDSSALAPARPVERAPAAQTP